MKWVTIYGECNWSRNIPENSSVVTISGLKWPENGVILVSMIQLGKMKCYKNSYGLTQTYVLGITQYFIKNGTT